MLQPLLLWFLILILKSLSCKYLHHMAYCFYTVKTEAETLASNCKKYRCWFTVNHNPVHWSCYFSSTSFSVLFRCNAIPFLFPAGYCTVSYFEMDFEWKRSTAQLTVHFPSACSLVRCRPGAVHSGVLPFEQKPFFTDFSLISNTFTNMRFFLFQETFFPAVTQLQIQTICWRTFAPLYMFIMVRVCLHLTLKPLQCSSVPAASPCRFTHGLAEVCCHSMQSFDNEWAIQHSQDLPSESSHLWPDLAEPERKRCSLSWQPNNRPRVSPSVCLWICSLIVSHQADKCWCVCVNEHMHTCDRALQRGRLAARVWTLHDSFVPLTFDKAEALLVMMWLLLPIMPHCRPGRKTLPYFFSVPHRLPIGTDSPLLFMKRFHFVEALFETLAGPHS